MPSPTAFQPVATAMPDNVRILSFEVGHGECTLVEFISERQVAFRCLLDAGRVLPAALLDHLKSNPRPESPDLDVVVLSHVDNDHQGGLPGLLEAGISFREYLSPCLPAFKRLRWLFGERVNRAVDRAFAFEQQLRSHKVAVQYPLEGFKSRYASSRVTLSIISPAARLIKTLASGSPERVSALVSNSPTPLQWLFEVDEPVNEDSQALAAVFDGRVTVCPEDFDTFLPGPPGPPASSLAQQHSQGDPDFFGNATLNDTSLIVVLDILLDGVHRKRLLFPGDQENWTYVAAQHPAGLGIDVMKAPHHGGRVYLRDKDEDLPGVYAWLRPKTVIVSANGQYDLPRASFRDVLRTVGGSLLCAHQRTFEALSAGAMKQPTATSCFQSMGCDRGRGRSVTVTLTADSESADLPACVQGSGITGLAPIVVLRQDVTVPSEGLLRYTYGELDRHATWIKDRLDEARREFLNKLKKTRTAFDAITEQPLTSWRVLAALAKADGRHDLVADPDPVLKFARSQHVFWCAPVTGYRASPESFASLPAAADFNAARRWLKSIPSLLLIVESGNRFPTGTARVEILQHADWGVFDHLLAGKLKHPAPVIADEVRPVLLPLIAADYSFRLCHFNYPDSHYDGGKAFLLLQRDSVVIPDLLSPEWQVAWDWHAHGSPFKAPWKILAKLASEQMLAGTYLQTPYGRDALFNRFKPSTTTPLPAAMHKARWVTY
ncbi:hypothetical protein [Pseudomonas soli]|uniref:hypothetical protein n=1 Tax=Pseudomonas soli TaxID=1306993 RepID=UPI0028A8C28A|nr:hypothetical protein [Pseudomonas soli]